MIPNSLMGLVVVLASNIWGASSRQIFNTIFYFLSFELFSFVLFVLSELIFALKLSVLRTYNVWNPPKYLLSKSNSLLVLHKLRRLFKGSTYYLGTQSSKKIFPYYSCFICYPTMSVKLSTGYLYISVIPVKYQFFYNCRNTSYFYYIFFYLKVMKNLWRESE